MGHTLNSTAAEACLALELARCIVQAQRLVRGEGRGGHGLEARRPVEERATLELQLHVALPAVLHLQTCRHVQR